MYWFFNCNNYLPDAIKALVYSAYKFNPHFKPICIWDEPTSPAPKLKAWLKDRGVFVYSYRSAFALRLIALRKKAGFLYEARGCEEFHPFEINIDVALNGMWSKLDVPSICVELGINAEFVLLTDPDCIFAAKYNLKVEPDNIAAGPEEEPYRDWISGGIYVFNVKKMIEDRKDFEEHVIENYREIGYHEALSVMEFYGYDNITHIPPDWNYKPYWEKKADYLISPQDRAIFRAIPKLIHFQGIYKPWGDPPMPKNTDMEYYCNMWHEFVKLSESSFKFNS